MFDIYIERIGPHLSQVSLVREAHTHTYAGYGLVRTTTVLGYTSALVEAERKQKREKKKKKIPV